MMFESLFAQILHDVYRRPRMLLHLMVTALALILLEYAGIRPQSRILNIVKGIENAVGLRGAAFQGRGVLIAVDLFVALIALIAYLVLVFTLFSLVGRALNEALEHLDLSKPFDSINKLRNSCFVEGIVSAGSGKRRWLGLALLSLLSIAIILSYYSSIAFLLYALNDWLSIMGMPLLQLLTSSGRVVFLAVTDLFLVVVALMLLIHLRWGSYTEGEGDRDMFNEWIEYLIRKHFFDNCVRRRGAAILASLTPIVPRYRAPRPRYFTLAIPRSLAEARFDRLTGFGSTKADESKPQYSIVNYNAFKGCIGKPLDMERLKEGVFKNLCAAKLYM